MTNKFSDRGYPLSALQKASQDTSQRVENSKRVAFVTTYHPYTNFFKKCILEHWPILGKAYPSVPEFSLPPLLCYKRPQNIKDMLVRADIGSTRMVQRQSLLATQKCGTFPCLHCPQCSNITKENTFSHPRSGKLFHIKVRYVGETTQHIRDRISQHRSTIRCQRTLLPVPAHFISAGHTVAQLRFQIPS
ncbi:unnamed protein product [Ranitomeya imitator]|uniref:Ribosomal protein S10 n=1 Tax=Ranitomeya imitator TaxID=111125 RepID=A0ABN9LRX9_9NEOB|nr:unnamed protein product [Ranitomeya imitator]